MDLYAPMLPLFLPLMIDEMGLSYFLAGLIVTAFNVVSSITQPLVGLYGDKKGKHADIAFCVLLSAVGISFSVLSHNYLIIIMLAMGAAIGHALFHPAAFDLVYRLSPPAKRGLYNSIFITSGSLSYALGPFIAGLLIAFAGLPSVAWMVFPGLIGAAFIFGLNRRAKHEPDYTPKKEVRKNQHRNSFAAALVIIVCSLRAMAYIGLITYLPTLLILGDASISTLAASAIVTIMLLFGVVGQMAGGYLSDLFGRKEMLFLGFLFAVPSYIVIFLTDGFLMYAGIMLFSFFASFCYVTSVTMSQELLPNQVGFASGLIQGLCLGLGGLGAALIGWIADSIGSLSAAMFLLAIPVILCPIITIFVKYPRHRKNAV
ncbi:MAG: MFS transporter [Methanocorpusculum sp.]|nr:MFS transporter [Methanocorpusculum sp.]